MMPTESPPVAAYGPAMAAELRAMFAQECAEAPSRMKMLLFKGDFVAMERFAHNLKYGATLFALSSLRQTAIAIESAATRKDTSALSTELGRLETILMEIGVGGAELR